MRWARNDGTLAKGPDPGGSGSFELVLYPNPPLSRTGMALVLAPLAICVTTLGASFALLGAWPVSGLLGLDVVLLGGAFAVMRRRARRHEVIRLGTDGLVVSQVAADGRSASWRFEPGWVRVDIEEPPRRDSLITLSSHGRALRLGAFITPEERIAVATELRRALREWRPIGPEPIVS